MTTTPDVQALAAELREHIATHAPSCNARVDHLLRRAALALAETEPHATVLAEIAAERNRQDAKWGEQNHRDGTSSANESWAERARANCQQAADEGALSWAAVLYEEFTEAMAEDDPARLRAELVQVAAVAAAWVEAIDRRAAAARAEDGAQ